MARRKYASLTADLIKTALPARYIGPDGEVIRGYAIVEQKKGGPRLNDPPQSLTA